MTKNTTNHGTDAKVCIILIFLIILSCQPSTEIPERGAYQSIAERYDGPIIDMHIHAFQPGTEFGALLGQDMKMELTGKTYRGVSSMDQLKDETFAKFKKHRIVKAMVSQGELWYDTDPDVVIIGNHHYRTTDELRAKHSMGKLDVLGEIAPSYQGILPTDERLTEYFDLAEELGIPMAYHMYPGGPPGGAYFMYPKTRAIQAKPLQLEEILLSHPTMKIYIMHAGWPYLEDMKALMYAHPQVYVDLGVISWVLPRQEFQFYVEGLVRAGFGKRIMYGTDQMVWVETIDDGIEALNSAAGITIDQKADIFYNNAADFLGLSPDEIRKHHETLPR